MGQKFTGLLLILVLMTVSGIGGFLVAGTQPVKAPAEHQAIVDMMVIRDTVYDLYLEPKCVDADKDLVFAEHSISELGVFEEGRSYQQSTWLWERYGDTELGMTIWGPGEDAVTCSIEIGRLSTNSFEVRLKGEVVLQIPNFYLPASDGGWYSITVEVT